MSVLIVDGNNIASRSKFAMKTLRTTDGRRSGTVHGFLMSLSYHKKMLELPMSKVVIIWDGGRSKQRLELYPGYKANRKPPATPEDIEEADEYKTQLTDLVANIRHLGVTSIRAPGVEADDLISIYAHSDDLVYDYEDDDKAYILSGDGDFHQLHNGVIRIVDPSKGSLTEEDILKKWEGSKISPILWKKLLTGDPSDGITGVPKVGDVRAKLVLSVWETYEDFCVKDIISSDRKIQKWVDVVNANKEVIERNFQIMRLPKYWNESFYDNETQRLAEEQSVPGKKDLVEFTRFLKKYGVPGVAQYLG